jgi:AbrB family looped-hinge helix DNA binding protein
MARLKYGKGGDLLQSRRSVAHRRSFLYITRLRLKKRGGWMAIYRTLYYGDVSVGVGGRITIPQDMRDDLGIDEGDTLTVRVEENPDGGRQIVMWRAEQQPDDE